MVQLARQYAPRTISARVRGAQPKELSCRPSSRHDVTDTDHWLASPKREEVFGPLGVTNIRTFVNPGTAADAMEYDGVLPETLVLLVEA